MPGTVLRTLLTFNLVLQLYKVYTVLPVFQVMELMPRDVK